MTKTSFASLSLDSLTSVVGGYHDPVGPSSSSGGAATTSSNPDDFASKYVGTLKKDGQAFWKRENMLGDAIRNKQYGNAAKQWGAAVLDGVGTLGDALSPIFGGGIK